MTMEDVVTYLVITGIPLIITIVSFYLKLVKDKRENENRITKIESKVENQDNRINLMQDEQKQQREDLKILGKLESQNELMLDMIKELKESINLYKQH